MPSIRIGNDLKRELENLLKKSNMGLTNNEFKAALKYMEENLQAGRNFEDLKKYLIKYLPKAKGSNIKEKIMDALCDSKIFNEMPEVIEASMQKVAAEVRAEVGQGSHSSGVNDKRKAVQEIKQVDSTWGEALRSSELLERKIDQVERKSRGNVVTLMVGAGATTLCMFLAFILFYSFYSD